MRQLSLQLGEVLYSKSESETVVKRMWQAPGVITEVCMKRNIQERTCMPEIFICRFMPIVYSQ